jgi:hypothetical protein
MPCTVFRTSSAPTTEFTSLDLTAAEEDWPVDRAFRHESPHPLSPGVGYNRAEERALMTLGTTAVLTVPSITSDQALRIARLDAERVYRDLSPYRASIALEQDGWHVDYELKDSDLQGGGPHYVIDPGDGAILTRQYEQ